MKLRSAWQAPAAWTLAVATLLMSLGGLIALQNEGEARVGGLALMRVAAGYDRSARAILDAPALAPPARRRHAAELSRKAIDQFPYDVGAWLRLAYVDYLANGRLTPQGLAELKRSYDVVGVDSELGFWRVRFALENSQALSAEVRTAARNEVSAMAQNPDHRATFRKMLPTIQNPAGRLSLALWLNRLGARVAK